MRRSSWTAAWESLRGSALAPVRYLNRVSAASPSTLRV